MTESDILKLLVATDEFGLQTLNEYIQGFLIENQKEFLQNDPIGILEIAFRIETFEKFKDNCIRIICQEPDLLFGTDKILALPAEILESLLKREDLTLTEIEVWNNLIKWVHAQHPNINHDPFKWTNDDIEIMEQTIQRFIPLIIFQEISCNDYYGKIFPYEELLPKYLKSEIMHSFLVTNETKVIGSLSSSWPRFDPSLIITKDHLKLFIKWINRNDETLKKRKYTPYEFNLIYRGSRDGFGAKFFHSNCDDKGATIVVAKIKDKNQIVGGYNPLDWNGDGDKTTCDSFIFSFKDPRDISTGEIGRVIETQHAIRCFDNCGPLFGKFSNYSNDLTIYDENRCSSISSSYPNLNIPRSFTIHDYEVFQVVKKSKKLCK